MRGLLSDCRHALRLYARAPFASLVSVVVLGIGIAFFTSFLSLYVDLVLKPASGFDDGSRIVTIANRENSWLPFRITRQLADELTSIEAIVAVEAQPVALAAGDDERLMLEYVSRGFFDQLKPEIALGRGIEAFEHDIEAEPVAVISDEYWEEKYGRSASVIDETIELRSPVRNSPAADAIDVRIVGVMAPEMRGVSARSYGTMDMWVAYERVVPLYNGSDTEYQVALLRSTLRNFARLKPGVTVRALANELESRYPDGIEGYESGLDVHAGIVESLAAQRDAARQLGLFLAGSVLLAVVAAANVSLYLLARAPGRRRELAIRVSIGAPPKRLARLLATESALLVFAGALLGLVFSYWLVNILRGMDFLRSAEWNNVTLFDWRVLVLAGGFMLLLTVLVSLAPVLGLKRVSLAATARDISARATLGQRIAGNAQITIAMTFGGAAIAFVWFLASILLGDPGYQIEDRYQFQFLSAGVSGAQTPLDPMRRREMMESLPGIRGVTVALNMGRRQLRDPVDASREIEVDFHYIDDHFLDVLGYRLLHGRGPNASELGASLVNEALARSLFGRVDVVGEVLEFADPEINPSEIVGVVPDISYVQHPAEEVGPTLFMNTRPPFFRSIVDSPLPGQELVAQLRNLAVAGGDPQFAFPFYDSLARMWEGRVAPDKARGFLTITTASLVVLIAIFGFYGTQRYLVNAGRREYAIRAALGAGPRAMGKLVFSRGLMMGLPGLIAGALCAFILVAWLRDEYLSREVSSIAVTAAVAVVTVLLLLVASLGPAMAARRTQPAPLLREE